MTTLSLRISRLAGTRKHADAVFMAVGYILEDPTGDKGA